MVEAWEQLFFLFFGMASVHVRYCTECVYLNQTKEQVVEEGQVGGADLWGGAGLRSSEGEERFVRTRLQLPPRARQAAWSHACTNVSVRVQADKYVRCCRATVTLHAASVTLWSALF